MRKACSYFVARRPYSNPGLCQTTRGVKLVRWAPSPLKTQVARLCSTHRNMLESGKLELEKVK